MSLLCLGGAAYAYGCKLEREENQRRRNVERSSFPSSGVGTAPPSNPVTIPASSATFIGPPPEQDEIPVMVVTTTNIPHTGRAKSTASRAGAPSVHDSLGVEATPVFGRTAQVDPVVASSRRRGEVSQATIETAVYYDDSIP